MSRLIFAVLMLLTACGPDDPQTQPPPPVTQPPPPPPPAISTDFNGRWTGTSVVSAPGQTPTTQNGASLVLAANGTTLTASGFCPNGSGVMTITGQQGRSLNWDGSVVCAYASPSCSNVTNTYVHATMSLDSSNTLTVVAYANLAGCGYSFATTTTFTGRK